MPKTRTELHQGILNRLDETLNSEVAALQSGTGTTPTLTTTATLDLYLDAALGELYRTCLLLPGYGTVAASTARRVYALSDLTATLETYPTLTGGRVWWADGAAYNGTALLYASQEAVRRYSLSYRAVTAGTPTHFYRDGEAAIGLYQPPSFTATLSAGGYCVPPSITAYTLTTYLPDAFTPLLEDRVAEMVVEKQFSDASLFGRWETLHRRRLELATEAYNAIPRYTRDALGLLPPA